jgi:hypothetical protein
MELMTGPLTRLARWKQMALVPSPLLSPLWVIAFIRLAKT